MCSYCQLSGSGLDLSGMGVSVPGEGQWLPSGQVPECVWLLLEPLSEGDSCSLCSPLQEDTGL